MYIKTFIPKSTSLLLDLPDDFVGEQVRIVAVVEKAQEGSRERGQKHVAETYSKYPKVDLTSLKFDREEANENC
ncbi:hypothetical protein [Dyadobacter crusticola]|uniref:hypothetical protein n=1 Tax=Dyadobacter crusticola TaxID=292407 RepID=UPI0004E250D7|nr:hypothetical protein [Dyadobacter crusticola]